MTACLRPFISDLSTDEQTAVLAHPDATFRLLYWDVASVGATPRDILAYGKAKWTNQLPTVSEISAFSSLLSFLAHAVPRAVYTSMPQIGPCSYFLLFTLQQLYRTTIGFVAMALFLLPSVSCQS